MWEEIISSLFTTDFILDLFKELIVGKLWILKNLVHLSIIKEVLVHGERFDSLVYFHSFAHASIKRQYWFKENEEFKLNFVSILKNERRVLVLLDESATDCFSLSNNLIQVSSDKIIWA